MWVGEDLYSVEGHCTEDTFETKISPEMKMFGYNRY